MDNIPGFPFLRKVPTLDQSKTKITCQHCGAILIVEESLWVNQYTEEQYIWCESCTTQVGCFKREST